MNKKEKDYERIFKEVKKTKKESYNRKGQKNALKKMLLNY